MCTTTDAYEAHQQAALRVAATEATASLLTAMSTEGAAALFVAYPNMRQHLIGTLNSCARLGQDA